MWTIQPVPAPGGVPQPVSATLAAVSCPSARDCFAVGSLPASGGTTVLVDRWGGLRWAEVPAPSPGGTGTGSYSAFTGISCTSSTRCEAVGTYTSGSSGRESFAESWGGSRWTVQRIPLPTGQSGDVNLSGVSCASPTSCVAVGSLSVGTSTTPIAEVWNGSGWTAQTIAVPPGAGAAQLDAVSCSAAGSCQAVGGYAATDGREDPLVAAWNGAAWREAALPIVAGAVAYQQYGALSAIACANPAWCVAVGSYSSATQTELPDSEVMNGTTWSAVSVPQSSAGTPPATGLSTVACQAANSCTAAGIVGRQLLIERWDGTAWTAQPAAPAPRGTYVDDAGGVACPTTSCLTVGSDAVGNSYVHTDYALAELSHAGGRWALRSPVLRASTSSSELNAISCASSLGCIAVGDETSGGMDPLAESWDGHRFTIEPVAGTAGLRGVELGAVSCPAASWCMAVGASNFHSTSRVQTSLALSWNGSRWARAGAPAGAILDAVSCPSQNACLAVGPDNTAESWNGRRWSLLSLPGPPGLALSFGGVSCSSSTACTIIGEASGYCAPNSGVCHVRDVVIAERRDGGRGWTLQRPVQAFGPVGLVSCPAIDRCIAVGVGGQVWNGTRWSAQPIPGTTGFVLSALSCPAADSCTAVGSATHGTGLVAEAWNGSRWSSEPIPSPRGGGPASATSLNGVSCPSRGFCIAVGSHAGASGRAAPFAERFS